MRRRCPKGFRFSVKAPRELTHYRGLGLSSGRLESFLEGPHRLGPKLGALLVQLPPSLVFDRRVAERFFDRLRALTHASIACEPRHPSWFLPQAEETLARREVTRVAAEPAIVPEATEPGGWKGLFYFRLHGSPQMYYSAYSDDFLVALASALRARRAGAELWGIFDNTAAGAAIPNAMMLDRLLRP